MGLLDGKVVVITGAGSGLGKETAILLAKEGAHLALCGRKVDKMELMENELGNPEKHLIQTADVSKEEEVASFIAAIEEKFGKVDVLINNAAVFESYFIADTTLDSWNYHLNNNVTSAFLMTRGCIPLMRKQKSGKIISLTSSLAMTGAAGFGAYSASKAALQVLMSSVDDEEASNGIEAFSFEPGVMKSNLQGSGVHPSAVAPHLLSLVLTNQKFSGQVVNTSQVKRVVVE